MPVTVDSYEPDGSGGYHIQWSDSDQGITAFIHATPELLEELCFHHRHPRGAPTGKADDCYNAMRDPDNTDHDAIVEMWRACYEELIDDIKDLKASGLKHNTPHEVLLKARKSGSKVDKEWLKDQTSDGYKQFMEQRQ